MTPVQDKQLAERRAAAVIAQNSVAMLVADVDGRLLSANHAACALLGYQERALVGQPIACIYPDAVDPLLKVFASGESPPVPARVTLVAKDGSHIPVTMMRSLICDESGEPVALAAVLVDQSALQDAERRLRVSEARLETAQRVGHIADKRLSLGTIVAGVAHEVSNPNHVIALTAAWIGDVLRDVVPILDAHAAATPELALANLAYQEARGELPRAIDRIARSSDRIRSIIDELRRFSRDDASCREALDVNDVVRSALTLLRGQLTAATKAFDAQLSTAPAWVFGSASQLQHCVVNLLLNACEALDDEAQAITVETAVAPYSGHVRIAVRDEGAGIAEHQLPRITEPFYTTKGDTGAAGLGLTVTERIVRDHGGVLHIESTLGAGTTVFIDLPRRRAST